MKSVKRIYFLLALILFSQYSFSQNPINAFAKVTGIAGNVLSVNNVNETYHSFEDGDYIIIMQMQDDVIGTNTTNATTFGDLGAIQSAGLFEIVRISSHAEAASLPTSITLSTALVNTYNINTNSSVQIITFRNMGTNFTTSSDIGTVPWNGNVGGVTAFLVGAVLTLGHSISANGCGFAGGLKNTPNSYTGCDNTTYITALATRYAGKGDGIYKNTTASFGAARGKILNGGGGGNDVNAGGGGGGNYTSGGGGGSGWTSSGAGCSPIAGGLGGLSLSSSISGSRIFMGGGGGGGHENDNNGTLGTAGGGIILIKTGTVVSAACAGISISANGTTANNASNDGAGGGGAGGSIIFSANVFNVPGSCPLTVSSNGGNGGNSNASSTGSHGGGGGGGQGAVIYPGAQPVTNITTNTIPGTGGVSCSGCGAGTNGTVGSGTSNSGIIVNASGPLPIELVRFEARLTEKRQVFLEWATAVEKNSREFVLQRMDKSERVNDIAHIPSKGNNSVYSFTDPEPGDGINYYRLKEVALDGTAAFKHWIEINLGTPGVETLLLYPNPINSNEPLVINYLGDDSGSLQADLLDKTSGKVVRSAFSKMNSTQFNMDVSGLSAGVYIIRIKVSGKLSYKKLIVLN